MPETLSPETKARIIAGVRKAAALIGYTQSRPAGADGGYTLVKGKQTLSFDTLAAVADWLFTQGIDVEWNAAGEVAIQRTQQVGGKRAEQGYVYNLETDQLDKVMQLPEWFGQPPIEPPAEEPVVPGTREAAREGAKPQQGLLGQYSSQAQAQAAIDADPSLVGSVPRYNSATGQWRISEPREAIPLGPVAPTTPAPPGWEYFWDGNEVAIRPVEEPEAAPAPREPTALERAEEARRGAAAVSSQRASQFAELSQVMAWAQDPNVWQIYLALSGHRPGTTFSQVATELWPNVLGVSQQPAAAIPQAQPFAAASSALQAGVFGVGPQARLRTPEELAELQGPTVVNPAIQPTPFVQGPPGNALPPSPTQQAPAFQEGAAPAFQVIPEQQPLFMAPPGGGPPAPQDLAAVGYTDAEINEYLSRWWREHPVGGPAAEAPVLAPTQAAGPVGQPIFGDLPASIPPPGGAPIFGSPSGAPSFAGVGFAPVGGYPIGAPPAYTQAQGDYALELGAHVEAGRMTQDQANNAWGGFQRSVGAFQAGQAAQGIAADRALLAALRPGEEYRGGFTQPGQTEEQRAADIASGKLLEQFDPAGTGFREFEDVGGRRFRTEFDVIEGQRWRPVRTTYLRGGPNEPRQPDLNWLAVLQAEQAKRRSAEVSRRAFGEPFQPSARQLGGVFG